MRGRYFSKSNRIHNPISELPNAKIHSDPTTGPDSAPTHHAATIFQKFKVSRVGSVHNWTDEDQRIRRKGECCGFIRYLS